MITVGVVGLGAAGLRAAMLLEKAGVTVRLFEGRGRPGGRLHTADEGEGAVYEAGGEWIDADHHRVLNLLDEFKMAPLENQEWPSKVVYNGKHTTEALLWNDALEDDLRTEAAAREMCRELTIPAWKNTQHREWDDRTLEAFLSEQTKSERGKWWVTAKYRSDEGEDPNRIGLLGWLAGYQHYLERDGDVMSAFRIPGGSRQFCEKILASLKAEPEFGKTLTRITQSKSGVKLEFGDEIAHVDRVILTLPPPALERVVFEPALSVQKRCAVEACEMSRAVKIVWQFETAWWKDEGWGGSMLCEGPIQQTWDGSLDGAAILTAYICGDTAVKWAGVGDPVRAGLYELSQILPDAAKTFKRGWFHNWVDDRYSFGAFSHMAPCYVLDHLEHIGTPEDRVHFAGEHTASWTGFIEGALESAERVSEELIALES